MAKQKARQQKKKKKRRSQKNDNLKTHLQRTFVGLFVLIILVVAAGVLTHYLILPKQPVQPVGIYPAVWPPKFEIYPEEKVSPA